MNKHCKKNGKMVVMSVSQIVTVTVQFTITPQILSFILYSEGVLGLRLRTTT